MLPAHGRDSASAAPSCVPGQAVSPIAVLKPWSPVLVKPPAPSSSPQPQRLANFYLPSEEVDGQSSCEIGLRPQDCQIRELGVHLTSSIPSPVAPWPDQAAVCPTHTHTASQRPRGLQTVSSCLSCIWVSPTFKHLLTTQSFCPELPTSSVPTYTGTSLPSGGGGGQRPSNLVSTPYHETQALPVAPGTQFLFPSPPPTTAQEERPERVGR